MPDNLALRMRPRTISEVIGQKHLVGEGKIIRRMVEANMLSSMILYGLLQEQQNLLLEPLMLQLIARNACRKLRKRLNFQVA